MHPGTEAEGPPSPSRDRAGQHSRQLKLGGTHQKREFLLKLCVCALQQPVQVVLPLEHAPDKHVVREPELLLEDGLGLPAGGTRRGRDTKLFLLYGVHCATTDARCCVGETGNAGR